MTGAAASFILQFWAEPIAKYVTPVSDLDTFVNEEGNPCPKLSASFPSELAFSWFTGFAWTGFKRALTKDDLWDLPPELTSRQIIPRFRRNWDPAVESVLKHNASLPNDFKSSVIKETNGDASFNASSNAVKVETSTGKKESKGSAKSKLKLVSAVFVH